MLLHLMLFCLFSCTPGDREKLENVMFYGMQQGGAEEDVATQWLSMETESIVPLRRKLPTGVKFWFPNNAPNVEKPLFGYRTGRRYLVVFGGKWETPKDAQVYSEWEFDDYDIQIYDLDETPEEQTYRLKIDRSASGHVALPTLESIPEKVKFWQAEIVRCHVSIEDFVRDMGRPTHIRRSENGETMEFVFDYHHDLPSVDGAVYGTVIYELSPRITALEKDGAMIEVRDDPEFHVIDAPGDEDEYIESNGRIDKYIDEYLKNKLKSKRS
ncbi:MAG: hypothetical protein Q4C70_12140 [Planctomycetia bacterium]|nr:hypothetical protein [Planctomycetia bacterium]